ncbi:MAG: T9SS type A sorting domain-containing protein, partial [Flavobacteriaceae bacterium]|nr:T9SS type A sorting domain-containing protein [Flavobacteriaceae bacterium]
IYRILKSDFNNGTSITSEVISFSYEDQVNFTTNTYNHDFDAEAFSVYNNELIIFSKNWASSEVKAYSIPKTIGNHSAKNIGSYNSEGLITGATYNAEDNSFLLCGYNKVGNPLLLYLKDIDIKNPFNGVIERTDISNSVGLASQVEGITHISGKKYFLSRERVNQNINGNQLVLNQHLFRFDNGSFGTLSLGNFVLDNISIYPNPSKELIQVSGISIEQICIIDNLGRKVLTQKNSSNQIRINELTTGIYILKIVSIDKRVFSKKFIKN